jgi:hypothetical protein
MDKLKARFLAKAHLVTTLYQSIDKNFGQEYMRLSSDRHMNDLYVEDLELIRSSYIELVYEMESYLFPKATHLPVNPEVDSIEGDGPTTKEEQGKSNKE